VFVDRINERAKGELVINVRGGPEVIGQFDQAVAVKNNVVQGGTLPTGFMTSTTPGMDAIRLSKLTAQEERKRGMWDYINQKIAHPVGLHVVGRQQPTNTSFYWLFLKNTVEKKEDFAGLKLGGSPSFFPYYKALGGIPVKLAINEYYTAVERGVVDGNCGGLNIYVAFAEYEVAPVVLNHTFYNTTVAVSFNLEAWNSLPPHLQKLIMDVQLEVDDEWEKIHAANIAGLTKKSEASGAKFLTLSPDVAKWFVDTAYEAGWADDATKYPPDIVNKFKELLAQ